jgi:hypothetical protein
MPPKKKANAQVSQTGARAPGQGQSKSARKRRALANRMNQLHVGSNPSKHYTNVQPISAARDTGLRRLQSTPRRPGLSDAGIAFLKCAFAPPDFSGTSVGGVPDDYRGPSLVKKHRFVSQFTFNANTDYYFLLLPTPGISMWFATATANVPIVSSVSFNPLFYSDFATMFPSPSTSTSTAVRYRFVSNHMEIIPTTNQMNWTGSISCFKSPIQVIARRSGQINNTDMYTVTGLEACNSNLFNGYSGPFIQGLYSGCYSASSTFSWSSIFENQQSVPAQIGNTEDFGQLTIAGATACFPGMDNDFESLIIKVSGVTANETCILKSWACVEYQVSAASVLYDFTTLSPCDKIAMELYREIISELPVGVGFEDNDSFWQRVLNIIHSMTSVGALLPGTVGTVSRGVNLLSQAGLSFYR